MLIKIKHTKYSVLLLMVMVTMVGYSQKKQKLSSFEKDRMKEYEHKMKTRKFEKTLIDFFKPMPIKTPLISKGTWGETYVFPRDTANGLEDSKLEKWCYWDGKIVKDDAGKYHIYASRWPQSVPHSQGWRVNSTAIHAVSDDVIGPYVDTGIVCPEYKEGKGHNVVGLRTKDGKYAVVKSSLIQGSIFLSDKPEGPFEFAGEIKVDLNGHSRGDAYLKSGRMDNVDILLRPDGRYMLVGRPTVIMISEGDDILGPYKIISDRVKNHPALPKSKMEDPSIWFSGGMYHMIINHHTTNTTYHMSSLDGINDWKYRGMAFNQQNNIFKYTDGTVNKWTVVQRMTVYVEGGHPTHFIFSVVDTKKGEDLGNDQNGSKIIVVPFDGIAFDKHMQELVAKENAETKN